MLAAGLWKVIALLPILYAQCTEVPAFDCDTHTAPLQLSCMNDQGCVLEETNMETGHYTKLYDIPPSVSDPPMVRMNALGLNPIDLRFYASLQDTTGETYFVRFGKSATSEIVIDFLGKFGNWTYTGAFVWNGDEYWFRSHRDIYVIEDTASLKHNGNLAMDELPKVWTLTRVYYDDGDMVIVSSQLIGGQPGPRKVILAIRHGLVRVIDVTDRTALEQYVLIPNQNISSSVYGAAWVILDRAFFAANDGSGVVEVDLKSLNVDKLTADVLPVGKSDAHDSNDGTCCHSFQAFATTTITTTTTTTTTTNTQRGSDSDAAGLVGNLQSGGSNTGATSTTTTTPTTSTTTLTSATSSTSLNTDCTSNPFEWEVSLTNVDVGASNLDEVIKCAIAAVQGTSCDCVAVSGTISRRLSSRRLATVGRKGTGGAPVGSDSAEVEKACQSSQLGEQICAQVGQANCSVTAVCGQFTTTTEMPWGMPWWAWFLMCCGICGLFAVCCLPLLGAAPLTGRTKSGRKDSYVNTEVVYEVVDEPVVSDTPPARTLQRV